ncbi:MAG: hypothetical protein EXR47_00825 [Dehalococcoidia bacterium]|nr:hypothetical protein [Dehalococcoidia bacterium]
MGRFRILVRSFIVLALVIFAAAITPLTAHAKGPNFGSAQVMIEGGAPSPFTLPQMAGQSVTLGGENLPPGAQFRLSVAGLWAGWRASPAT